MLIELFNSMITDKEVYYLHLKLYKNNQSDLEFMKKLGFSNKLKKEPMETFKEVRILKAEFFNE